MRDWFVELQDKPFLQRCRGFVFFLQALFQAVEMELRDLANRTPEGWHEYVNKDHGRAKRRLYDEVVINAKV